MAPELTSQRSTCLLSAVLIMLSLVARETVEPAIEKELAESHGFCRSGKSLDTLVFLQQSGVWSRVQLTGMRQRRLDTHEGWAGGLPVLKPCLQHSAGVHRDICTFFLDLETSTITDAVTPPSAGQGSAPCAIMEYASLRAVLHATDAFDASDSWSIIFMQGEIHRENELARFFFRKLEHGEVNTLVQTLETIVQAARDRLRNHHEKFEILSRQVKVSSMC